ncbi:MAG: glycine cleavage system protein GcvH [Chloroflexi bacterium]|nr:glycine cleavage system protein GcvH [Chloroflexota bacterium]
MKILPELVYTDTDEWVKADGQVATVGITDFAQDQLSDVVYVEMVVAVGDTVSKGDQIATVESVKAAADVNSPVSGTVVEVNEALPTTPELVNKDPYGQAWMVKIEMEEPAELSALMNSDAYDSYCAERSH